jgi:hypothetical protein
MRASTMGTTVVVAFSFLINGMSAYVNAGRAETNLAEQIDPPQWRQ